MQWWILIFNRVRQMQGIVQQNSDGDLEVAGTTITGVASATWATFTGGSFDLTTARYVHVSDRHSTRNATATPGSLWRIDPTAASAYKRQLVSAPIYYSTVAAGVAELAAASYPDIKFYGADVGADYISNGTSYDMIGYNDIIRNHNVNSRRCVFPLATFGTPTCSDAGSGGNTTLTGAGAHGLTQAMVVDAGQTYIYISAGTGWTAGWYLIVSRDSTTAITIDTASYNANPPTVTKVGDAGGAVIYSATLPRYCIGINGELDIDTTFGLEGTITAPTTLFLLNTTQFNRSSSGAASGHTSYCHNGVRIRNVGAYNSQIVPFGAGSGSANNANQNENGQTAALATGAVDFSAADVTLNIAIEPGAADNVHWVRQLVVRGK